MDEEEKERTKEEIKEMLMSPLHRQRWRAMNEKLMKEMERRLTKRSEFPPDEECE